MTPYQAVATNHESGSSHMTTQTVAVKLIIAPP